MAETTTRIYELQVKLAQESLQNLKKLSTAADVSEARMVKLGNTIKSIGVGAALATGINMAVRSFESLVDQMDNAYKASQKLGITTEEFTGLSYAAKLAGVETEAFTQSMTKLAVKLADVEKGTDDASKWLRSFGVTGKDSPAEALEKVAEGFSRMQDGATKAAASVAIFGKTGAAMIPMLNGGANGLREMRSEAEKLGIVISGDNAKAAEAFNDNLTKIGTAIKGMSLALTSGVIQDLEKLTGALIESKLATDSWLQSFLLLSGAQAKEPVKAFYEAEKALVSLNTTRSEVLDSWVGKNLPLLVAEDVKILDKQIEVATKRLEVLRKLAGKQGAFDFGPPNLTPKTNANAGATETKATRNTALDAMIKRGQDNLASMIDSEEEMTKAVQDREKAEAQQSYARLKQLEDLPAANALELYYLEAGEETMREVAHKREMENAKAKKDLEGMDKLFANLADHVDGYGKQMADSMVDFAFGADDAKQSFSDMATSILRDMVKMATQVMIMDPLMKSFKESLTASSSGEGLFGFIKGMFNAKGGIYDSPSLSAYSGGIYDSPRAFAFAKGAGIFGEAGPEAIMPLKRGSDGSLGVEANGSGGDMIVIINNESKAEVTQSAPRTNADGSRVIELMVRDAVSKGFNSGAFDGMMGATFGLQRRGAF